MSSPDTNIKTQRRRHAPALLGIAAAGLIGAVMAIAIFGTAITDDSERQNLDTTEIQG